MAPVRPSGLPSTRPGRWQSLPASGPWTSIRNVKESETTNDFFAFLTTEPNKEVGAIHPEAMPVILTTREEIDLWMNAPAGEALQL
jgi:putative SOS response-associated peptidase YedK